MSLTDPNLDQLEHPDPDVREKTSLVVQNDKWLAAKIPFNQGSPEKNARMADAVTKQYVSNWSAFELFVWKVCHMDIPHDTHCEDEDEGEMDVREFNWINGR